MERHIARLRAIAGNLQGKADNASLAEAIAETANAIADALEDPLGEDPAGAATVDGGGETSQAQG